MLPAAHGEVRCVRAGAVAAPLPLPAVARPLGMPEPALVADGLEKHYLVDRRSFAGMLLRRPVGQVRANRGVGLAAPRGRTVAIVGESGCGKSTFARIVAGLDSATAGTLLIDGVDLARRPVAQRTAEQLRALQMVFQNPDETLNPSYSVGRQIGRVLRKLGGIRGRRAVTARVDALLAATRLPAGIKHRLPRELSGGQKQRVGHCAGVCRRPGAAGRGRAGVRAGRLGPRRRYGLADGLAGAARHHGAADQPRSRPGPRHGRRGGW